MLSVPPFASRRLLPPRPRPPRSEPRHAGRTWWIRTLGVIAISATSLLSVIEPARAEFSAKDGQVLGRTLAFVGDGMTGTAVLGIVFMPDDPLSRREAEQIQAVIGTGLTAGRVRLCASLVTVDRLAGLVDVKALYVTSGLASNMKAVSDTASRLHIPTVSIDMACVRSGNCVLGFSSQPTVQIVIDHAAAERAGMHFLQAFRMLVRER